MANEYYTLITNAGRALEVQAKAGKTAIKLTHMAVGDGNDDPAYAPAATQTALKRERWRCPLNRLAARPDHPDWLMAEAVLPEAAGGWWIREVGLFTDTGTLYAIGRLPPTFKPLLAEGGNKMLYVQMIFEVSNAVSVTLLVDPSVVLATRSFVDERFDALFAAQTLLAAAQVQTMHRQIEHEYRLPVKA